MRTAQTFTLLCMLGAFGCAGTSQSILISEYDEAEMDAAIERARREVDSFIRELSNPTGTSHAVKVPIEDNGEVEHFWLIKVKYEQGTFSGEINNQPETVTNVSMGQNWTAKSSEISDWLFMKDGKMHGNYTLRPLLQSMPPDEAAKARAMLAEP